MAWTWRDFVKAYLVFAALHTLAKLYRFATVTARITKELKKLPGEPFDLLARDFLKNVYRLHEWRTEKALRYDYAEIMAVPMPFPEIQMNSPRSIKWMLKDEFQNISKPSEGQDLPLNILGEWLGKNGIFVLPHGSTNPESHLKWFHQRKTASRIFTRGNFTSLMRDTFLEKCDTLNRTIAQAAEKGEKFDFQRAMFAFTMDSIMKIFFNRNVNTVSGERDPYAESFDTCHRSWFQFLIASPGFEIMAKILPFPFGSLTSITNYDRRTSIVWLLHCAFNKSYATMMREKRKLDITTNKIIDEALGDPRIKDRTDLLAQFINLEEGETPLTREELLDTILNSVIAGRDTTACTLSWACYILCTNPEIQDQLHEEIVEKLGENDPSWEDLNAKNMPYLNGLLYETFRLYPPVPFDYKLALVDLEYEIDGIKYFIPKGIRLGFSPYAHGRNPKMYKDPLKVDPNRWIPFKAPSAYELPTFQGGDRLCLGREMAIFESKLVLCKVFREFQFKLVPGEAEKIGPSLSATMAVSNSLDKTSEHLWVLPTKRQPIRE